MEVEFRELEMELTFETDLGLVLRRGIWTLGYCLEDEGSKRSRGH